MTTTPKVTKDSIMRAFDFHQKEGRIYTWRQVPGVATRFTVVLKNGDHLHLTSLREAHILAAGLASAAQAERKFRDLTRQIAGMDMDGEQSPDRDEPFIMESDDAKATVDSLISLARKALGQPDHPTPGN